MTTIYIFSNPVNVIKMPATASCFYSAKLAWPRSSSSIVFAYFRYFAADSLPQIIDLGVPLKMPKIP